MVLLKFRYGPLEYADMNNEAIRDYLLNCRELNDFTTRNGWIDDDTITFEILEDEPDGSLIMVEFTEVIREEDGNSLDRVPCTGKMRLSLDHEGHVLSGEISLAN